MTISKKTFISLFILICASNLFAQSSFGKQQKDASTLSNEPLLKEGLYTSYKNLLNNANIDCQKDIPFIQSLIRDAVYCKSEIDWREASYSDKDPFYPCKHSEGKLRIAFTSVLGIELDSVWAFFDGHFIYCNVLDNFYPVIMTGRYALINCENSLKKFKITDPIRAERNSYTPALSATDYAAKEFSKDIGYFSTYSTKTRQFLLSMESGVITEFNHTTLGEILKTDSELYNVYLNTKPAKLNKMRMLYKFNQKYPLLF